MPPTVGPFDDGFGSSSGWASDRQSAPLELPFSPTHREKGFPRVRITPPAASSIIVTLTSMGRPRRNLQATAEETLTPPAALEEGQAIAQVKKAEGKNLYSVELPFGKEALLVELPARFRSTIWLKRGGFVVIDTSAFNTRENKLGGEIVNVVRDEKQWRKQSYWPATFVKSAYLEYSDDEESTVGKMPPTDESEDSES